MQETTAHVRVMTPPEIVALPSGLPDLPFVIMKETDVAITPVLVVRMEQKEDDLVVLRSVLAHLGLQEQSENIVFGDGELLGSAGGMENLGGNTSPNHR